MAITGEKVKSIFNLLNFVVLRLFFKLKLLLLEPRNGAKKPNLICNLDLLLQSFIKAGTVVLNLQICNFVSVITL